VGIPASVFRRVRMRIIPAACTQAVAAPACDAVASPLGKAGVPRKFVSRRSCRPGSPVLRGGRIAASQVGRGRIGGNRPRCGQDRSQAWGRYVVPLNCFARPLCWIAKEFGLSCFPAMGVSTCRGGEAGLYGQDRRAGRRGRGREWRVTDGDCSLRRGADNCRLRGCSFAARVRRVLAAVFGVVGVFFRSERRFSAFFTAFRAFRSVTGPWDCGASAVAKHERRQARSLAEFHEAFSSRAWMPAKLRHGALLLWPE